MKTRVIVWLAMSNKVLTWEVLQKRSKHNPTRCVLCKHKKETIDPLLIKCPYARMIWLELEGVTGYSGWHGDFVEDCM
jgi:hypothetical protein